MQIEVFTCDEKGCEARLERDPGMGIPCEWLLLELPAGVRMKPVHLCPRHRDALIARFAHVPVPRGGREVPR